MNRFILLFFVVALASCKTPSFNTANNMRLINGSVILNDGKEIAGAITSDIENNFSRTYITITPIGRKESERINITDIKSMTVRGNLYEPKLIDMGFGSRDQLRFVKRLTKENSRIHLYELYEQQTTSTPNRNSTSNTRINDNYSYYIVTPQHTLQQTAWNIEGRHLTPNFEDKMSEIVKDCPALADKIRHKEKGYFYAKISLVQEKRIETMFTIIDEYNNCK